MTREEMLADLAYARTLAEEGRHAPLLGGAYLLFWGVLNACAFTAQWAILTERLPPAGSSFAVLWITYGLIAAVGMTLLGVRTRTKPGLTSIGGRAERAIWAGAATALLAIAAGSILRMFVDADPEAPNFIIAAAFAIYGVALFGVARLSEQHWLAGFGWLSAAVALVLCVFLNEPWAYLIAAADALLVLAVPGVTLLRNEPSSLV
jgi:hypothetical protein